MSYEATVLADTPALYYRLDQVGPAASGDSITDLSGNALHGFVTFAAGGIEPYGYASPIETDASSRAFRSYSQGDSVHGATITRASSALIEPAGDLALEAWIKPNVLPCNFVGKQKTFDGYCFLLGIDTNGRLAFALRDSAGTAWNVIAPGGGVQYERIDSGEYYHLVGVRQGATLAIYVNGVLNASTTITSGLGTLAEAGIFYISAAVTGPNSYLIDEVAIYTHALSAARVLAHYEAAKFVLPLTATLTTRVVVELDTDATLPVDFPFAHNFAEAIAGTERPLVEHLAFKTNVNQSEPDYQQRINAQPYHLERTIETAVTPVNARGRAIMQAALWKPGNVYPLPVSNDWSELTSSSAVAATILNLDTRWRDYEVGSYVGVWADVYNPTTYQRFRITSVTDTQLGITPAVVTSLPAGSVAMPARLACLPEDTLALESHLVDTESAVLQFEVLATELSTRRVTAYVPTATYKSVEVFSLVRAKVEWADPVAAVSHQLRRRVSGTGNPNGNDYQRAVDTGSPQTIPLRILSLTRQSISEFYGWLAARQGRQNPVWIVSQDNDLPVTATTATTATIAKIGYTAQYNAHSARRDVAFLKTDGTYVYKRITAAVDNGDGTETLTLPATVPSLATIVRTSFLKFCTAPDVYEIHYHRAGTEFLAECAFVLTELLTTPA